MNYNYILTDFLNDKCDTARLTQEIQQSSIIIALDYINTTTADVTIYFKDELSIGDKSTLDGIIANHSGEPLPEESPIIKAQILTEAAKWVEAGDTTQELFSAQSLIIDVSDGDLEIAKNFSWPYTIAIKSGTIYVTEDMIGDEMSVHEAPNTLIGYLMQPLNVGDTSMYVSETVIQNMRKAYYVGLYQPGEEGIEVSQVLSIDAAHGALSLATPSDVSAGAYSYIAMCGKMIPELLFTINQKIEIGKTLPTANRLPANIPMRVYYKNNNAKAKTVSIFVEYLY
jgi:hypothetical protein